MNLNYLASWHDILEVSPNYISNIEQLKLEQYISSIEMENKVISIVSGGFDPVHPGHIMMMNDCLIFQII